MNPHLQSISAAFVRDMAHRFSILELLNTEVRIVEEKSNLAHRYGDGAMYISTEVQPTGQMAAIVRSLTVTAIVFPDSEVKNLYHGALKFSYDHHNGGSNGKDTDFIIAAETHFGNSDVVYISAIEKTAFNTVHYHLAHYKESLKDKQ